MNWPRLLTLIALASPGLPSVAAAIVIDGDLGDLEAAIAANLGSSRGGDVCADATGELGSAECSYYVNGYDLERFLVLMDPLKNPDGTYSGDVDVYVGWDAVGSIGDVDGNGDPDTYAPGLSCATSDQIGIGPLESYVVEFDFDCDGYADARFGVRGNAFINFFTLAEVPGSRFAYVHDTLEAKLPALRVHAGRGFDLCDMRISGKAYAGSDQLVSDACRGGFLVAFDPRVAVATLPGDQTACADSLVSWAITVRNAGPCDLDEVNVQDVLDDGLSYVSDDQGSTGDAQTRTWQFTNLPADASRVIHLTAWLAGECSPSTVRNTVDVRAQHNNSCREIPGTTTAEDVSEVECTKDCSVSTRPSTWGRIKAGRR
jgi:uncharacterized repeat protein (TIGR01451 family)